MAPVRTALGGLAAIAILVSACGDAESEPLPTASASGGPRPSAVRPHQAQPSAEPQRMLTSTPTPTPPPPAANRRRAPEAAATPVGATTPTLLGPGTPVATPTPPPAAPQNTVTPTSTVDPLTQVDWVEDRLKAVAALYHITPEGLDMLLDLDVRQMVGQPGFFGSYGFRGWTGVGQARPAPIMHELSHAYWGAFPVTGHPELTWELEDGADASSAMARYRRDVLEFMKQPPGPYEPFRSILRNIPGLGEDELGGLFHSIEADVVYNTGGNLQLLPPILRKYWDRFIQPGPWASWYEAVAWYKGLSTEQRRVTGQYLGFEHIDLEPYGSLAASDAVPMSEVAENVVRREERQRLLDFIDQFDPMVESPEYGGNFRFWRAYLRDVVHLHKTHPGLLDTVGGTRAEQVGHALGFLASLDGTDRVSRAETALREIDARPFLLHFLPAMDDATLVEMFRAGGLPATVDAVESTRVFVRRLESLGPTVDVVLAAAERSVEAGAAELTDFVAAHGPEDRDTLALFFELLGGADRAMAGRLMAALDDSTIRHLLSVVPATVRSRLETARLLEALSITPTASTAELAEGIDSFLTHTSGNFRIDRPQLELLFDVIVSRAATRPDETLAILDGSRFPWEGFIRLHPRAAVEMLSSDLSATARIARGSDELTFPPARFVYRLITADPEFAAQVVERLDDDGDGDLVVEALAHFAYDAHRQAEVPGLPVSLEGDGRFLLALLDGRGADWLRDRLVEAVRVYGDRTADGDVAADFLKSYRATLEIVVAMLADASSGAVLERVIEQAFASVGRGG